MDALHLSSPPIGCFEVVFTVYLHVVFACDTSLCLVARKAGGRDSDREGQMETKTAVCHGCRSTGTGNPLLSSACCPSFPSSPLLPFLLPLTFLLLFFASLVLSPPPLSLLLLSSRLLSICSSLPVPSSGCRSFIFSGICFFVFFFLADSSAARPDVLLKLSSYVLSGSEQKDPVVEAEREIDLIKHLFITESGENSVGV